VRMHMHAREFLNKALIVDYKSELHANCMCGKNKKDLHSHVSLSFPAWSHLGLNQGPHDYESCALTN
jgi:hypothetical protein